MIRLGRVHNLAEKTGEAFRHDLIGKALCPLTSVLAKGSRHHRIGQYRCNRLCHRPVVAGRDKYPRDTIFDDLGRATVICRNQWLAERHGLNKDEPKGFTPRRMHHDVEGVEPGVHILLMPGEIGLLEDPELPCKRFKLSWIVALPAEQGTADNCKPGLGISLGNQGRGTEKHVLSLPGLEPSHNSNHLGPVPGQITT